MEKRINIFVVDDEPAFGELMARAFGGKQYAVEVFTRGSDVIRSVKDKKFDIGLIDIRMPDMDGIELIKTLKGEGLLTEFIILTGQATVTSAIEAMKLGCYDYLTKPIRLDELEVIVQKAYEKKVLNSENIKLKDELQYNDPHLEIIGDSAKMRGIFSLIDKVSMTSTPVLVTGESGTGKELVARAVHKSSNRKNEPFIIIDCASLSENLLENELFGHEKGAFTDATSMKRGLFEVSDGGTLFVDEIGEMKLSTQAKLLRVLETHQFRRLGSTRQIEIDVRIIAATNRNLTNEIKKGNFREDLYYRLNVFNIHLPPLRERKEDIPLLAKHFIETSTVTNKKRMREEDVKALMNYDWPGNVRELANVIERALIISPNDFITPDDFLIDFSARSGDIQALVHEKGLSESLEELEMKLIRQALIENNNNRIEAAKKLKISRANLYRKLVKYKLLDE